jgi:hypothetical protein
MQVFKSAMSWVLIVAGCLMVSTYGIVRWTEQQVLSTDNWVATMATLPKDKAVAEAIGGQIVDRMFEGTDVTGDIQGVLPPRLIFLAPTISGFLRDKADELAVKLIQGERFTQFWVAANRTAHERLIIALRKPAADSEATAALPYKINLAQAQDWLQTAAEKSDNAGLLRASNTADKVETFNASLRNGLNQARALVRASDALYALLPYAILASFLGAIALAKRRFRAVVAIGIGVTTVSVLAIAGVNFVRPALLNMLEDKTYQPIFSALWTSLMPPFLEFARSMVVLSFLGITVAFAWHKGVFSLMIPRRFKKQNWYKKIASSVHTAREAVIGARQYLYGAAAALSALYLAFWPDQTPLSIVCTILVLLAFVALTYIVTTPRQKHS